MNFMLDFSSSVWWYVSRATGVVALVLCFVALLFGLLFASRSTPRKPVPAWWLAMHKHVGSLFASFVAAHVVVVVADPLSKFGVVAALVPGVVSQLGMVVGVCAMWVCALVTFTSVGNVRKLLSRRVWHWLHVLSVPMVCLALWHAIVVGTDTKLAVVSSGVAASCGVLMYPLVLRLLMPKRSSRVRRVVAKVL